MVSINDVKNIDRPGYQPFSLNFSCSDLLTGNKTTRNIAMFLASNNLHSTDKTVLINTTQQGAKGVGFRLVQGNKTSSPILFPVVKVYKAMQHLFLILQRAVL